MERTLKVTATLFTVATDLHARPGDRLMVVGGVVVGVYTGVEGAPAASGIDTRDREAPTREVVDTGKAKARGGARPGAGRPAGKRSHADARAAKVKVLDWMQANPGEHEVVDIASGALSHGDRSTRGRVYNYLDHLVDLGQLEKRIVNNSAQGGKRSLYRYIGGADLKEVANG